MVLWILPIIRSDYYLIQDTLQKYTAVIPGVLHKRLRGLTEPFVCACVRMCECVHEDAREQEV